MIAVGIASRSGRRVRGQQRTEQRSSSEAERPIRQTKLVALKNAVTAAVHTVNPSIQVIGLGARGAQISTCWPREQGWMPRQELRCVVLVPLFSDRNQITVAGLLILDQIPDHCPAIII
jgi:hypothetical protein